MEREPSIERKARTISEEVRAALSALYGPRLRGLYLYGSYARGEETDDSDIDFLVLLNEVEDAGDELETMSELGSRLSLTHDLTITFYPVSVSEFQNLHTPFLLNVRREAVEV
jgi:predicted nucleotidyltransferase